MQVNVTLSFNPIKGYETPEQLLMFINEVFSKHVSTDTAPVFTIMPVPTDVWDFVAHNYPKYSQCNDIAENDDLQKIVDGELDKGSCAESLYNSIADDLELPHVYPNSAIIHEAGVRLRDSNAYIFEKAIQGFIDDNGKGNTPLQYPLYAEEFSEESWKYNCELLKCNPDSEEITLTVTKAVTRR